MLNRRLAALLVAVALAAVAITGCADQTTALRVGDDSFSDAQLYDELDAFAGNEALWREAGQSPDVIRGDLDSSYDSEFVAGLLRQRVFFILGGQLFDEQGLELDDDLREMARQSLDRQYFGTLGEFPEEFREGFVDDVARLAALEQELGADGLDEALVDAANTTKIEVSSRYGRWDSDRLAVVPPESSQPARPPIDVTDPFGG